MRASCVRPQYDLARDRGAATLALLSFAMLIVSLDQYIVIVALPDIGRELGYSSQTLQSVISAYAVASSGFLLFGGRAADLLGRRRRWSPASLLVRVIARRPDTIVGFGETRIHTETAPAPG